MKTIVLFLLVSLALAGCRSTSRLPVVRDFDVDRYLGRWYELVRYPHRFEAGLIAVSADYSRNPDGTLRVINRGYETDGAVWREIEGVAKMKGAADRGWLKVSFFKPFYASYRIVHLDADYSRAIVTGPTFSYFWILARTPSLPEAELDALIRRAETMGFERARMIRVAPAPPAD